MSTTTRRIGALLNSDVVGTLERGYQNTRPYVWDSTLFEQTSGNEADTVCEAIPSLAATE